MMRKKRLLSKQTKSTVRIFTLAVTISKAMIIAASSSFFGGSNVTQSVQFVRVSDQKVIFSENPEQLLNPASVTKLLISAASLDFFGPEYVFETQIRYRGKLSEGIIKGDIILRGGGDPFLVSEILWPAILDLKKMGIKKITGNVIVDNGLFNGQKRDLLRQQGKDHSTNAYDAPISALGINFNSIALSLVPGDKVGAPGKVEFDPYPLLGMEIENHLKTVSAKAKSAFVVSRVSLGSGAARFIVRGSISMHDSILKVYRSVNDPVFASGSLFKSFLREQGIEIQGTIKEKNDLTDSNLLYTIKGKTLTQTINGLNAYSNNFIADVLTQALGVYYAKQKNLTNKTSLEAGTYALRDFLKEKVGIENNFTLENGSGLTLGNRLSAAQITKLLLYVHKNWQIFPEFLASLPKAGLSGSLQKRFSRSEVKDLIGNIRAKTGSLTEPSMVSSLAGYMQHEVHGLVAFCVLQNGKEKQEQPSIAELHNSQEKGLFHIYKNKAVY